MRRLALVLPLVALLVATPVAASSHRYCAPFDGQIDGKVVVKIDADREGGTLKWDLTGLREGKRLIIDVNGGTCETFRGHVVQFTSLPLTGTSSAGEVALPSGSAGYFLKDFRKRGGVTATVKSGAREACESFLQRD